VVGRDGSHYANVWFDILTPVSAEIGAICGKGCYTGAAAVTLGSQAAGFRREGAGKPVICPEGRAKLENRKIASRRSGFEFRVSPQNLNA